MFAKLKKKIQEEGGAPEGERSPAAGPYGSPGYSSPVAKDAPGENLFMTNANQIFKA